MRRFRILYFKKEELALKKVQRGDTLRMNENIWGVYWNWKVLRGGEGVENRPIYL